MDAWRIARGLALGVLRRRKGLLVVSTLGAFMVLVPLAYYQSKEPPRYRTSASLILESRPDRVPLFQDLLPARPVSIQMAILKSRTLTETVIENLPKASLADLLDNPYNVDYTLQLKNLYYRLLGIAPEVESTHQRILKELRQARMSFTSGADGIVQISAEASKPQVAVDIVNTYVDALLSRTRSVNLEDARVSREFLETQAADTKKTLRAAEDTLRQFTTAHGGVKIPERAEAAVAQLGQVESALAEVESSRKMIQTRLRAFREKLEKQKVEGQKSETGRGALARPAPSTATGSAVAPELARLRDVLAQLESGLVELRLKYTDQHPRVALVREQILEAQARLAEAVKNATPAVAVTATSDAVPVAERSVFTEQMLALETAYQTVTAQEDGLRKQAEAHRQNLKGLSRSETEYSRLVRELESARSLSHMLSDKLTAARIHEQGEMKVVKVIDPAAYPQPATGEKRVKFLAGSLVLSLLVGIAIPAGVEWARKTIDSEEDVKRATGLPVLAILPRVTSLPLGGAVAKRRRPRSPLASVLAWPWRGARAIARATWRALAWSFRPLAVLGRFTWRFARTAARAAGRILYPFAPVARWVARPMGGIVSRRRTRSAVAEAARPNRARRHATLRRALGRRGVLAILPGRRRTSGAYGNGTNGSGDMADLGASFVFADALRRLQVAVQFAARSERLRTILVASAYPSEGKSTLVANLGHSFRAAGNSAVIVDADFHRPTLHRVAAVNGDAGVVDALDDGGSVESALVPLGEDLWLVPRGAELTPRARAALAAGRLNDMMRELAERADIVLCDSAPVLLVPENLFVAAAADGVILVAKAGVTTCTDLASAKATLDEVGARVLGVVINEMPLSIIRGHYKRYQKAYMRSQIA